MEDEDWELLSWVKRSKNRRSVLLYLLSVNEPRTPSEVSSKIEVSMNHISRALRQMTGSDERPALVKCLNPDAPYDRHYKLTDKGKELAQKIKEVQEE